jgi:hypothetical protein
MLFLSEAALALAQSLLDLMALGNIDEGMTTPSTLSSTVR